MRRGRPDAWARVAMDVGFLIMLGLVAIVVILLAHIGKQLEAKAELDPQGSVTVELFWPDDASADVDLWVRAPGDIAVGYMSKSGRVFNLLRDDLGIVASDMSGKNFEIAVGRGRPDGEYVVNVHYYHGVVLPLPLRVVVSLREQATTSLRQVLYATPVLYHVRDELTIFRFRLEGGRFQPESVHDTPVSLRARF